MKTKKGLVVEAPLEKMPKEAEKQEKCLLQGLCPNVLIFEDNFVKEYHSVETQQKEREIKFFQCIGDPTPTEPEKSAISDTRHENAAYLTSFNKDNDLRRYDVTSNGERVVVPVDLEIKTTCKWNVLSNDLFSLRQRNLNNLVKMATVLMTRIRVSVRLSKIKSRFDQENVRGKEDAQKLVHEDWKEAKKVIVGEETKGWKFEVDFMQRELECAKLPVEYDLGVATFKEPVEATDISSFDDLIEYQPLEILDYEVHKYEPLQIPAYFNYFPIEDTKPLRPGAEYEYSVRGVRGDPELGDKKVEEKFTNMPATMLVPLEYNQEKLVIPNTSLRVYTQVERYSEVDIDHHLQPKIRPEREIMDEISMNHKFGDSDSVCLSKYIPGNIGLRVSRRIPARVTDFYKPSLAIRDRMYNLANV